MGDWWELEVQKNGQDMSMAVGLGCPDLTLVGPLW